MNKRTLPRKPPPPLEGRNLERHFTAMWNLLWTKVQLASGYSPVTVGSAREYFVKEFLETHLPTSLKIGSGHVIDSDRTSGELDIIVYRDTGLALPLGISGLFFPESVEACIEVKSTLTKKDVVGQIANNFRFFKNSQPLKIVFAVRLDQECQHRRMVAKWVKEESLSPEELPDIVIVLENSAIIRGATLNCLGPNQKSDNPNLLYKIGNYRNQKWLGLMILIFELAQRVGKVSWGQYLQGIIDKADFAPLPD